MFSLGMNDSAEVHTSVQAFNWIEVNALYSSSTLIFVSEFGLF